jgi:hypothetical protein
MNNKIILTVLCVFVLGGISGSFLAKGSTKDRSEEQGFKGKASKTTEPVKATKKTR